MFVFYENKLKRLLNKNACNIFIKEKRIEFYMKLNYFQFIEKTNKK